MGWWDGIGPRRAGGAEREERREKGRDKGYEGHGAAAGDTFARMIRSSHVPLSNFLPSGSFVTTVKTSSKILAILRVSILRLGG